MAWIEPKYWITGDYFNAVDFNRIKNDINELYSMLTNPDFELEDMGNDKAINDFWTASEFDVLIDNIELIAISLGGNFSNKPYYYPNGATPTVLELNVIERKIQNLYNRINKPYRIYLGQGGSLGSRMVNRLI